MTEQFEDETTAFQFHGRWQDYAPIAFTNLLLTIVTLGIYRFWATTRTRRYLWSQTRFIDERLEWTGTGKELFIGFLLALLLFGVPLLFLQFGAQALILRGHADIAGILSIAALGLIVYVTGVARFRGLRYRLSRTFWHGIRGGSNDNGLGYGLSYVLKNAIGYFPFFLLVPWAMISLWNERWRKMSFGPHAFRSEARARPIFKIFLLFYLSPILIVLIIGAMAVTFGASFGNFHVFNDGAPPVIAIVLLLIVVAVVYMLLGLIALAYYAAYLREGIGGLSLAGINFEFEATSSDWITLFIVDVLLVVGTLGIGMIFLSYRHWKFFITHLQASGEIDLEALTQSRTREARHGEGLLDALDMGAI